MTCVVHRYYSSACREPVEVYKISELYVKISSHGELVIIRCVTDELWSYVQHSLQQ